jgi:hypothetical protein
MQFIIKFQDIFVIYVAHEATVAIHVFEIFFDLPFHCS